MANTKTNRTRKLWIVRHTDGYMEVAPSRNVGRIVARSEGAKLIPLELTAAQARTLYTKQQTTRG